MPGHGNNNLALHIRWAEPAHLAHRSAGGKHGTMTSEADEKPPDPPPNDATRLVSGGRDPFAYHGFVNPPVYHASTVLYRTAEDYLAHRGRYQYGRRGTPTSEALADALTLLDGAECAGVALLPSGLAAASVALLSVLK